MGLFDSFCVNVIHGEKQINKESNQELINYKLDIGKNNKKLFVLLPPWGNYIKENYFIRKQILEKGESFLELEFPRKILSNDWKKTLYYFKEIEKKVKKEIENLNNKYQFDEINIMGVSIGCVNACMIANNNKNVNNLYLIVPGNCLAECMWNGIATQSLRKSYEEQNITLQQLKNYWKELAPENNINLYTKNIFIQISKRDKIINYEYGEKLIKKIQDKKLNLRFTKNNIKGHYLSAIFFLLNPKKILFKENN